MTTPSVWELMAKRDAALAAVARGGRVSAGLDNTSPPPPMGELLGDPPEPPGVAHIPESHPFIFLVGTAAVFWGGAFLFRKARMSRGRNVVSLKKWREEHRK